MRFIQKQNSTPTAFVELVTGVAGYNALYRNQKQAILNIYQDHSGKIFVCCINGLYIFNPYWIGRVRRLCAICMNPMSNFVTVAL